MSETDALPEPRSRKLYLPWSIALTLLLGLGLLSWLVVVPVWQTRRVVKKCPIIWRAHCLSQEVGVSRLGGAGRARKQLRLYMRVPDWVAPQKFNAVYLMSFCGSDAVPELVRHLDHPSLRVQIAAAQGLGRMGGEAAGAVPALERKAARVMARAREGLPWRLREDPDTEAYLALKKIKAAQEKKK